MVDKKDQIKKLDEEISRDERRTESVDDKLKVSSLDIQPSGKNSRYIYDIQGWRDGRGGTLFS